MKELRLHDTAFLTRCYTSHALCSYIDSEIIIRHFIISQFFHIVTVALKMIIDSIVQSLMCKGLKDDPDLTLILIIGLVLDVCL